MSYNGDGPESSSQGCAAGDPWAEENLKTAIVNLGITKRFFLNSASERPNVGRKSNPFKASAP